VQTTREWSKLMQPNDQTDTFWKYFRGNIQGLENLNWFRKSFKSVLWCYWQRWIKLQHKLPSVLVHILKSPDIFWLARFCEGYNNWHSHFCSCEEWNVWSIPPTLSALLRPLPMTFIDQRSAKENIGDTNVSWDWRCSAAFIQVTSHLIL